MTGGSLITSLLFGHFGHIGRISIMPTTATLKICRELGLALFLLGAGVSGGANFVKYFKPIYFLYGMVITTLPLIIGYFFARYVLKLALLNNLGSITGGMTSTPALGTLIHVAKTEDAAAAYACTYPIALISVVLVSQLIIIFLEQPERGCLKSCCFAISAWEYLRSVDFYPRLYKYTQQT